MNRKLPIASPEQIMDAIERWRAVDLSGASDAEIESVLARLIAQLEPFPRSRREEPKASTFYRVRKRDACTSWPPRTVAGLLYVPRPTSHGRCHVPGTPTLYASKSAGTCLAECRAEKGDELLLIEYRAEAPRLARVAGSVNPAEEEFRAERYDAQGWLSYRMLRDFLRVEFTRPVGKGTEHLYRLSAAFCRAWLDPALDGWVYPSVLSPLEECVAFRQPYVDSDAFLIVGARHCTVLEVRPAEFELGWLQEYEVIPRVALVDGRPRIVSQESLPKLVPEAEISWESVGGSARFEFETRVPEAGFRFRVHGRAMGADVPRLVERPDLRERCFSTAIVKTPHAHDAGLPMGGGRT